MSNYRRSSSSCLTVAAFIIIAFLAVRYYGSTKLEANAADSSLYQKGKTAINEVWSYAKVLANVNLIKNLGIGNANLGQNLKNELASFSTVQKVDNSNTEAKVSSSPVDTKGAVNSYDVENNRPFIDLTQSGGQAADNNNSGEAADKEDIVKTDSGDLKNVDLKKDFSSMFSFQKTSEGAEIIIRTKSGAEYKLPLPFKFLAK